MKNFCRLATILCVCALSLAAFAQNVTGKWKGKIDLSAIKATTDTEKKQLAMMKQMLEKTYLNLDLKANKSYSVEIGGFPGQKPKTESGTWSQSGRTITVKGKKTESMTVSADGKTLTMIPPSNEKAPKGMKIIFKRG